MTDDSGSIGSALGLDQNTLYGLVGGALGLILGAVGISAFSNWQTQQKQAQLAQQQKQEQYYKDMAAERERIRIEAERAREQQRLLEEQQRAQQAQILAAQAKEIEAQRPSPADSVNRGKRETKYVDGAESIVFDPSEESEEIQFGAPSY